VLKINSINHKNSDYFQVFFFLVTVFVLLLSETNADPTPKITIIIDDVGDNKRLGYRAAKLPKEVALSILPHTPFSKEIARFGYARGMDIMLHQPMESLENNKFLGPGALLQNMTRQEFTTILENNINAIPFVIGLNNHMGSLLTTDYEKMGWLMDELNYRGIFFIDSRTTTKTVAAKTAKYWQSPALSRRIFLDHTDEPEAIAKQFQRLLKHAKKYGQGIAIGHPRSNTLEFLEKHLPLLSEEGVELVSPSIIIRLKYAEKFVYDQQIESMTSIYFNQACNFPEPQSNTERLQLAEMSYHYKCIGTQ